MIDDDDLFAPRPAPLRIRVALPDPAPTRVKVRKVAPTATKPPQNITENITRGPVASYACICGFRDEVREPAPDRLDCGGCGKLEGSVRIVPRYTPPPAAGRTLTAIERQGITLDRA